MFEAGNIIAFTPFGSEAPMTVSVKGTTTITEVISVGSFGTFANGGSLRKDDIRSTERVVGTGFKITGRINGATATNPAVAQLGCA